MLIDWIDHTVGEATERAICSHHRRRLRRVSWDRALDPAGTGRWPAGEPPPREGCSLDVLIDGEDALPAMADAISAAKSHVHVAGWFASPDFELIRGAGAIALRDLLAETAERIPVRVLLWAGSPAPVFSPTRRTVREARDKLTKGTRIRCGLDAREHPIHCHHEKIIVVDDEVAFVGGIDLTELGGDRFDRSHHPHRDGVGWHDVSSRLRGPIVGDVAGHFALRWKEVTDESLAPALPATRARAGEQTVELIRTIPQGVYERVPRGDYRILEAYIRALRSAQSLIYIENQFLWSPEIVEILTGKLANRPSEQFRIVVLLPVRPNNGADVTRGQVGELERADDGAGRLVACSIYAQGDRGDPTPVYVHSKVCIVDDQWLTLGSANLNERSLFNDSEVNVCCEDPALATAVRERLWAEHLEMPIEKVRATEAAELVDQVWRPVAKEQAERRESGQPLTHRLVRLPGVSRRSRQLLGPLDYFAVDA